MKNAQIPRLFNDATKTTLANLGLADDVNSLESSFKAMTECQVPKVTYGNPKKISEEQRARKNLEVLSQGLLHRSVNLMRAAAAMVGQANVHGLALLTRGHIETTAQLGYFCDRLISLQRGNITFDQFHERLAFTLLGASHPFFKDAPKPLNILTCIEKADRHLKNHHENDAGNIIEDCYSWLSDYCHPNFLSNVSSFSLDKRIGSMDFRHNSEFSKEDGQLIGYLSISAGIFDAFFTDINELASVIPK